VCDYVERVLIPLIAVVSAGIVGVLLARTACTLAASDAGPDWRGRGRRFQVWVSCAVAAASAASSAGAALLAPEVPYAVVAASFAGVGPGLAVVDVAARRLPFVYTGSAAGLAVAALGFTPDLARSLVMAFVVAAVMIMLSLLSKGGAGGGDVAFAALAALALMWVAGWWLTAFALVAAMFATGVSGLLTRLAHDGVRLPPYGPSLAVCWWLAYIYSIVD
jgi:hypothetical protein